MESLPLPSSGGGPDALPKKHRRHHRTGSASPSKRNTQRDPFQPSDVFDMKEVIASPAMVDLTVGRPLTPPPQESTDHVANALDTGSRQQRRHRRNGDDGATEKENRHSSGFRLERGRSDVSAAGEVNTNLRRAKGGKLPSTSRHRQRKEGADHFPGGPDGGLLTLDGGDAEESGPHDYNPDDQDALEERKALLMEEMEHLKAEKAATLRAGSCEGAVAPSWFHQSTIPYWVCRLSDILLYHNTVQNGSDAQQLPVDSAVLLLRADMAAVQHLLKAVQEGREGSWPSGCSPIAPSRSARRSEIYGPAVTDVSPQLSNSPPTPLQPTGTTLPVVSTPLEAAVSGATVVVSIPGEEDEGAAAGAAARECQGRLDIYQPILPPELETLDEQRPLLDRMIPLWRRRGAAVKTLTELFALLQNRLAALESRLDNPTEGPLLVTVGAPGSSGVNGLQPATLAPALEHAYATLMTHALLSDLFTHPTSALTHRAERLGAAFTAQVPHIHDHYIIEEDVRPVYDYLVLKNANMLEDDFTQNYMAGESAATRRSFTIHIDYLRLHPAKISVGAALGTVCRHLSADDSASYVYSDNSSVIDASRSLEAAMLSCASTPFTVDEMNFREGGIDATFLNVLSLATTQGNALVSFTAEEYLVAALLQHYERYRLLTLNLLPHLKSRAFYVEQLQQLALQPNRSPDVVRLQEHLRLLAAKAAEVERGALNWMIAAWRAVLQLRGGAAAEASFVVTHRRPSRAAFMPLPPESLQSGPFSDVLLCGSGGSLVSGSLYPPRHVTEVMDDVFHSDSTSDEGRVFLSPLTTASPVVAQGVAGSPSEDEGIAASDSCVALLPAAAEGSTAPTAFRFFLRRQGQVAEVPYILGEDVLQYVPVVEGVQAMGMETWPDRGLSSADLSLRQAKTAAADGLDDLDGLQFFQIVVFARSHTAVAPQYVGCTLPRPMTATKTIFFNESFEIRGLREPQEMIMHVINVSTGRGSGNVVATARLRPTLIRSYLLVPLESPIAFVFRGKSLARYPGSGLSGILSVSTTWTSAEGMTVTQIEQQFLSGQADPMDPQYAPLLRSLKSYYDETDARASEAQRQRAGVTHARGRRTAGARRRDGDDGMTSNKQLLRQSATQTVAGSIITAIRRASATEEAALFAKHDRQVPVYPVGKARGLVAATPQLPTERLYLMHRRWSIASGEATALNQLEAAIFRNPIPLTENEQYELLKRVQREVADRQQSYSDTTFDVQQYKEQPPSTSGLALSPLPKGVKLRLWHERQRRMQLTRRLVRHATDEEKLAEVVTVPTLSVKLVFDLKPRSQWNPRRMTRLKNEDIDRSLLARRQDSHIVVHVMKAYNLPQRADGTTLEPFVQVSFVYENVYSRCEVGSAPAWFQSLEVPFQPLDFEEDTLRMIDDSLIISVYDKVEIPMPTTMGAVSQETHYRTERRLLGTVRLPFYSLHEADEARMEGVYHLQTPRWLLGYDVPQTDAFQNPFESHATQQALAGFSAVNSGPTIQLYISLSPPLQRDKVFEMDRAALIRAVHQLNAAPELQYLHHVALQWKDAATTKIRSITRISGRHTARKVVPFVECSTGDLVLACRYLLPHGGPPPEAVTNPYEAIRYVSLLPFVVDIMLWNDQDVWSTNVELLTLRSGDYEELALLLAHLLRYLAPENATYVVMGRGDIYRETTMVLHAFEGTLWRLIDPRTGRISPVESPFGSSFMDVSVVLSHNQMWANTQLSGLPHRMTWDLNNARDWLPCFNFEKDKRLAACVSALTSLQREVLSFLPVDHVHAKKIEVELRAALKRALLGWRNNRPPAYHRSVEAILRELLVTAEEELCTFGSVRQQAVTHSAQERLSEYFGEPVDGYNGATAAAREETNCRRRRHRKHRSRSQGMEGDSAGIPSEAPPSATTEREEATRRRVSSSLHLVGSPVTASYNPSDRHFDQILQQVFESAVHEVGTDDVSFAAGVYVKSFTGDVCAMWVFLVAICRQEKNV